MTEFLYERDLRSMKYNILTSSRHDRLIGELGKRYGMRTQELRKLMMEKFDMSLLENLPARYEVALSRGDGDDDIARSLGRELLSRYIPLLDSRAMDRIVSGVKEDIAGGTPRDVAIERGIAEIQGLIRS